MRNTAVCLACVALVLGCSRTNDGANAKTETGRGTFVSTNGEQITAIYYKVGNTWDHATALLIFSDKRQAELYLARSGSGTRYTNETAEWWEWHGEATYDLRGTNVFHGKDVQSK